MMKKLWRWLLITVGMSGLIYLILIALALYDIAHTPSILDRYILNKPFPNCEIIFLRKWGGNEFGFINADGNSLEYVHLDYNSFNLDRFLNGIEKPRFKSYITWSSDGQAVFTSTYGYPIATMIDVKGMQAIQYTLDARFENFSGRYRYVSVIPGTRQAIFAANHLDFPYQPVIGLVELQRDTVILVRYIGVIMNKGYLDLEIGPHPWCGNETLVFAYSSNLEKNRIVLYNIRTDHQNILDDSVLGNHDWIENPSCSPDGRWVAYTSSDGIYLVHPDGSGKRRIETIHNGYSDNNPAASWSPDGQWIVYHDCIDTDLCREGVTGIFKYNVKTSEKVKLTNEGIYPYWRQPAEPGREIRFEP